MLAAQGAFPLRANPQVQTAPVTEPRGQEEMEPPVAKGSKAIRQQREKCSTHLIVNADALFKPHRWTLNPDAAQTLDALGPLITKTGKHPARILAYTKASDSESENRDVAQRRAITVRTWLVNHQFVSESTPAEASRTKLSAKGTPVSQNAQPHQDNGTIEVIVDSCH
jgi:outer membrane protein OmpA-like peptidoglycan-associated protein